MDSSQVAAVSPSVYKSVLGMIKELKKMVLKWIRERETCSPSLIQMFEGTKRWFMDQVKIHFADSQKRYLQWRWRSAEKMFLQFREGKALTVAPAQPIRAANAATLHSPRGEAANASKKRQRKRIKIAEPPQLLVIPE